LDVYERRPKTRGSSVSARCGRAGGKRRWRGKTTKTHSELSGRRDDVNIFAYSIFVVFTSSLKTKAPDKLFEKLPIFNIFIIIL